MAYEKFEFNTTAGETMDRALLVAYLNISESAPGELELAALGKRVEDSSEEYDWSEETSQDILGNTFTTMKKPTITQSFDPLPLDADDKAARKIWELGIRDQNAQALANQDMVIAHFYAGDPSKNFAERYSSCAIRPTGIGGEGGGNITMPTEITYGGTRTLGKIKKAEGAVTFTEGIEADV